MVNREWVRRLPVRGDLRVSPMGHETPVSFNHKTRKVLLMIGRERFSSRISFDVRSPPRFPKGTCFT
jgi:hypothetical protein